MRFAKFYSKKRKYLLLSRHYRFIEWRLFIDSSKLSLKAVLLHQGNIKSSIPLVHAVETKESYDSMVTLLHLINYKKHEWKICADVKVVAMLSHWQQGYTKYKMFFVQME